MYVSTIVRQLCSLYNHSVVNSTTLAMISMSAEQFILSKYSNTDYNNNFNNNTDTDSNNNNSFLMLQITEAKI